MKDHKKLMIGVGIVVLIIIIGALAAGGNKHKTSSSMTTMSSATASKSAGDTSSAVATTAVEIKDYMFTPSVIKVKVGDTVTWTNMDSVHHNVVTDSPSADAPNGPLIGQGETYSFKFTKAGSYSIHCNPHPYMHATVIVE